MVDLPNRRITSRYKFTGHQYKYKETMVTLVATTVGTETTHQTNRPQIASVIVTPTHESGSHDPGFCGTTFGEGHRR